MVLSSSLALRKAVLESLNLWLRARSQSCRHWLRIWVYIDNVFFFGWGELAELTVMTRWRKSSQKLNWERWTCKQHSLQQDCNCWKTFTENQRGVGYDWLCHVIRQRSQVCLRKIIRSSRFPINIMLASCFFVFLAFRRTRLRRGPKQTRRALDGENVPGNLRCKQVSKHRDTMCIYVYIYTHHIYI